MTSLKIAKNLSLPQDTITSTMIVYGGKGMGKTNLLSVMCEELDKKHLKFSVMDPMGVCWGLQHGADKSGKGIDVLILGGVHGDIPIEPTAGAIVADLVVDETVSTVIDISRRASGKMWSKGERIRFVADYCTRLYERQGENRVPLLQFFDEAAGFAPQMIPHGAIDIARCSGAIMSLCEEGRNIGVGLGFFTLRSARLNKSVAELADCMISFRTVGPNSIKAILEWLGEHVDKSKWNDLLAKIRSLPIGQALVVSPGWLQYEGIAQIRPRETFDSSATPKPGKALRAPGKATKPDLKKYRERMKATIEKAQAEDPRALRAKIAELERQAKGTVVPAVGKTEIKTVEVPVLKDEHVKMLDKAMAQCTGAIERLIKEHLQKVLAGISTIEVQLHRSAQKPTVAQITTIPRVIPLPRPTPLPRVPAKSSQTSTHVSIGYFPIGERKVLTAIAQYPEGTIKQRITVLTGYKRSSRDTYLQRLREKGLIEVVGVNIRATEAGIQTLGPDFRPLPTGSELRAYWMQELPEGEHKVLEYLIGVYPNWIARETMDESIGYARSSRDTYLQRLGARHLVQIGAHGQVKASDTLFD